MCGICGWIIHKETPAHSPVILRSMTDTLVHRGPDDCGIWMDAHAALGHRRLSIVDISGGRQPMTGSRGEVITFNGEIYNYRELRTELIRLGHVFCTDSDTEVLLHAYHAYGRGCIDRLLGMFSFAIWDPFKKELFMARDRLGKKPFFYYMSDTLFAFASEIKALLSLQEIRRNADVNPLAFSDYLSLGYILAPKTIFANIHKLPAGHYAVYSFSEKHLDVRRYWELEQFFSTGCQITYTHKTDSLFRDLLSDAVRLRMRSDVPLGAFLSGGIDSSSVVALMTGVSESKVKTFCMGFNDSSYDESGYADLVARHLKVEIHKGIFSPVTRTELSRLVWQFDEPFSDNSFIPTFQIDRIARERVTVALSGDGADELLCGYPTYRADQFFSIYRLLPAFLLGRLPGIVRAMIKPSYRKVSWDYKVTKFLESSGYSPERAHYFWRTIFSPEDKKKILNPVLFAACRDYDPFEVFQDYFNQAGRSYFLNRCTYVDIKTWLQDDILVKVDRMSMANSLEVRSPFLDHRIVELAATLPQSAKISLLKQKVILKECMRPYLQKKTVSRPKKGFNTPYQVSFDYQGRGSGLISDSLVLSPELEDITFKAFNLSVLHTWLDIYDNFIKTGRWEPLEYDN